MIYDNEGSTKIYFHIEEYQGDAYVFNLRIIRGDIISFYETFESSFCRYEVRNVSWAELGLYRRRSNEVRPPGLFIEQP